MRRLALLALLSLLILGGCDRKADPVPVALATEPRPGPPSMADPQAERDARIRRTARRIEDARKVWDEAVRAGKAMPGFAISDARESRLDPEKVWLRMRYAGASEDAAYYVSEGRLSEICGRWLLAWETEEPAVTAARWASEYQGGSDAFEVRSIESSDQPPWFDAVVVNTRTARRYRFVFKGFFAPTSFPTWDMKPID